MQALSLDECREKFKTENNPDDYDYHMVRIIRMSIIAISSIALIINLVLIIKKKQYIFTTIKLFMYVQICYLVSLLSVVPHDPSFNLGVFRKEQESLFFHDLTECLVVEGQQMPIAVSGFINLSFYSLTYWFAICLTMYIRMVLQNDNKSFMKKKSLQIFSVLVLILLWYFVPFVLTFSVNVPFSFGPAGYEYDTAFYFVSPGIINRNEETEGEALGTVLAILWIYFWPLVLFIYHCYLLLANKKLLRDFKLSYEITPRQQFLLQSGNLSFFIFIVQIILVSKSLLLLLFDIQWHVIFVINIIFDLLGLLLLIIYLLLYYNQGIDLQFKSQISDKSLLQTFNDHGTNI